MPAMCAGRSNGKLAAYTTRWRLAPRDRGTFDMTIAALIDRLSDHSACLIAALVAVPLFSFVYGKAHGRGRGIQPPHRYVYSVVVYLSCVPGIFSLVITAYTMLFIRGNLLTVNGLVYFLPIVSMIVTIAVVRRNVDLDYVPGFDRLVGLCTLLAVTFGLSLALLKSRLLIIFGGPIRTLLILMVVIFLLLKWAAHRVFHGKRGAGETPPDFPSI